MQMEKVLGRREGELSVYDVFTPTSSATISAINRTSLRSSLSRALAVPGRQLFVYGRSGAGKSTLVSSVLAERKMNRVIVLRCTDSTTVSSMVRAGAHQFGLEEIDAVDQQRVAIELGRAGNCVVIEDAHRLPPAERKKLLDAAKLFSDLGSQYPQLKLIIIAALDAPSQFAPIETEVGSRIEEIEVPSMSVAELARIVRAGGEWLNVDTSTIEAAIAGVSAGSAAIAHQLALIAFERSGATCFVPESIQIERDAIVEAFEDFLRSIPRDIMWRIGIATSGRDSEARTDLLDALSTFDSRGADVADLTVAGRAGRNPFGPQVTEIVADLSSPTGGNLIEVSTGGTVRFSRPLLHSYWSIKRYLRGGPASD